jgi:hypothetical protein
MSEEQTEGTSIKSILIGLVSTITIAVGGFITNKLTGEEEKEEAPKTEAPVINVNMTNNQTQTAGKTVILNQPQKQKTTPPPPVEVKPKKTETEKRKEEGLDW